MARTVVEHGSGRHVLGPGGQRRASVAREELTPATVRAMDADQPPEESADNADLLTVGLVVFFVALIVVVVALLIAPALIYATLAWARGAGTDSMLAPPR